MPEQEPAEQTINQLIAAEHLYQHAPCGYVSFDAQGQILRINETFCHWLALEKPGCIKQAFTSLLTNAGALYFQMVVMPMLHREEAAKEVNFKFSHGGLEFDGLFNAVAYKNEQGEMVVVNAVVSQITNRKKYELELLQAKREAEQGKKKFEFLSNSIPNLIWTALPTGAIEFVNQRLKDYFQVDDLSWYSNLLFFPASDRERVRKAWDQAINTGTTLDIEVPLINQQGSSEWFLFRMEPYTNEQGEVELWIGSATTIHASKMQHLAKQSQLTLHLSTAYQTISENNGLFSRIAFNQSHMIRKPLANIMGLIPMLQEEKLSEEGLFVLKCLVESTDELDRLLKKVVDQIKTT